MNLTVIEPKAAEAHFHSHSAFAFAEKCRTDCQARRGNRPQTRGKLGGGPFQGTERRGWPCPPHPCRPSPTGPGPGRLATRAPSDAGDPHLRPGACLRPAGAPAPPSRASPPTAARRVRGSGGRGLGVSVLLPPLQRVLLLMLLRMGSFCWWSILQVPPPLGLVSCTSKLNV